MFYCLICNITLKRQGNHWWKHSVEKAQNVIAQISSALKGRTVWNKGKTWDEIYGTENANERKAKHIRNNALPNFQSKEARAKTGDKLRGKARTPEVKEKISNSHKGIPLSEFHRKRLSECHADVSGNKNNMYGRSGSLSPAWKNGKSFEPYTYEFNSSLKRKIKGRDNYKCQNCNALGNKKGYLYIHHIDYNKTNCDERNLITVCSSCNSKANFNREYWKQFYRNKINEIYRIVESS